MGDYVLRNHGVANFAETCVDLFNSGVRQDMFEHVAKALGATFETPKLVAVYRSHQPKIELFEDARSVLAQIKTRYSLGLITDGYAQVQRNKVAALGVETLFDSIVYSDDLGREAWKPSPLPYLRTMNNLVQHADRFVFIGDNPAKDFITARKLGWRTVRVERTGQVHPDIEYSADHAADLTVGSLDAIPWERLGG